MARSSEPRGPRAGSTLQPQTEKMGKSAAAPGDAGKQAPQVLLTVPLRRSAGGRGMTAPCWPALTATPGGLDARQAGNRLCRRSPNFNLNSFSRPQMHAVREARAAAAVAEAAIVSAGTDEAERSEMGALDGAGRSWGR